MRGQFTPEKRLRGQSPPHLPFQPLPAVKDLRT